MPTRPTRAIVIVLDSVGIGALPDAASYHDAGSNTLGNIGRHVTLRLPTLRALGLDRIATLGGETATASPRGAFGRMAEASAGKDSVTGHWEMMGVVLDRPFPVFPQGFPASVIAEFSRRTGRGVIGNKAASGTDIIDALGAEHLRTGALIVYTSADSVFQIAAHEDIVPLNELYRACETAFELVVTRFGVGRVIARPFRGAAPHFVRTANRRDYARSPEGDTLLDRLTQAGHPVIAIGKVEDLFAGRGITRAVHSASDAEGMDATIAEVRAESNGGLIFTNLVDFDTEYGHRNDAAGYAQNLERFDQRLAELIPELRRADILIVTADHGNDPTTPSTDHSREYVPLLVLGETVKPGTSLGTRETFADLGQTLAELFAVEPLRHGTSFLRDMMGLS